jgi:HEAT repeat protein
VTSVLFFAAGASVCLAAAIWLVLIAARAMRLALARRSRSSRDSAALALARFEENRDVDALARAIAPMKPERLAATLARRLSQLDPAVRAGVSEALARIRFGARLPGLYGSAPEGTRLLYCELLCEVPGRLALSLLEDALADRSPLVRMGAAMSLARLDAAPAPRALLDRLGTKACASSRLVLLFELLLPGREREIIEIAADPVLHPRTRLSALRSLALARPDLHGRLLPLLADDSSPVIAAEVARALPAAELESAPAVLTGLLIHESRKVRREAAQAAGAEGSGPLRAPLTDLLLDGDPTVASRAARALWDWRGESLTPGVAEAAP